MAQGDSKDYVQVANEDKKYSYEVMCPVIVEGDVAGGVILLSKTTEKENSRVQEKLAAFAADFGKTDGVKKEKLAENRAFNKRKRFETTLTL